MIEYAYRGGMLPRQPDSSLAPRPRPAGAGPRRARSASVDTGSAARSEVVSVSSHGYGTAMSGLTRMVGNGSFCCLTGMPIHGSTQISPLRRELQKNG